MTSSDLIVAMGATSKDFDRVKDEPSTKDLPHSGLYEGTLLKKPTRLSAYLSWSGWRLRYVRADDEKLEYFGRSGDSSPRGVAYFAHDCKVVKKGKLGDSGYFGFDVVYEGTTWSFASGNEKDVEFWTNVLDHKIRRAVFMRQNDASEISFKKTKSKRRAAVKPLASENFASISDSASDGDSADEGEDTTSGFSSELDDDGHLAEYGRAPEGFYIGRELRFGPDAATEFEGWKLMECVKGMRIFEMEKEFAGNSATDVNAQIDDFVGPRQVRCHAVVIGNPTQVFAMLMDVSRSRRAWDPAFVSATLDKIFDTHNDRLTLQYQSSAYMQVRKFCVDRYWCRENSGTYIISMTAAPDGPASSPPDSELTYMSATIMPGRAGTSKVVMEISVKLGGWLQYMRPLAHAQAVSMVRCLGELKELAEAPPSLRDPEAHSHCLPFHCELQEALDTALQKNSMLLRSPIALVATLRECVTSMRDLTDDERELERARKLMKSQQTKSHLSEASRTASSSSSSGLQRKQSADFDVSNPAETSVPSKASSSTGAEEKSANSVSNVSEKKELNFEYGMPRNNYIMPMSISKDGVSAWWDSGIEEGFWSVRGPNYLEDRVKVPNKTSAMELVQIQWSFYDQPKRNIAKDPNELVQLQHEGRSDRPFMLVINFMVPTIGNYVMYLVKRRTVDYPRFNRMLQEFINGDDTFRNSKFKIIPNVVSGSYIAKKGIGSTPAILGKKIVTEYYKGDNWFEICVDVGSSKVAGSLMGLVKSYAANLVIDLAFLFESQKPEELPEVLITGCRMHKPLMYPTDNLSAEYAKSEELYQKAMEFPPEAKPQEPSAEEAVVENNSSAESSETPPPSSPEGNKEAVLDEDTNPPNKETSKIEIDPSKASESSPPSKKDPVAGEDSDKTSKADPVPTESATLKGTNVGKESASDAPAVLATEDDSSTEAEKEQEEKPSLNYKYAIPHENNFLVPMEKSKNGETAVSDSGSLEGYHRVRGPTYLDDGVKVPSKISAMELVACQWSFYPVAKKNISADKDELIQRQQVGRKDRPFLLVVNFAVPLGSGEGVNMVAYFAKRRGAEDANFDRMLKDFISKDDAYRNSRFKIIPSVTEGYFIARRAIGSKPAILGRKITTEYYAGDNYFEICVDVGSSTVAESLMGVVKSYASSMVLDLAFLFEAAKRDELPERILGATRFHHPLMFPMNPIPFRETYVREDDDEEEDSRN